MDTYIIGCHELTKSNKLKRLLKRTAPNSQHETLSDALLRALSNLLVKFKKSPEVKAAAKKTVSQLHGIITTDLLSNSKSLINCSISKEADTEYSLYLNLKRIKVLAKRVGEI